MAKGKSQSARRISDFFVRGDAEGNRAGVRKWNRLTTAERSDISLVGADLAGCDLSGIKLLDVHASQASFTGATLVNARISGVLDRASFAGADLTGAKLTNGSFDRADFSGAKLAGSCQTGSSFISAKFVGADMTGANLSEAPLLGADLTGASLDGTLLAGCAFDHKTRWPAGFVPPGDMAWHGRGTDPRLSGKGARATAHDINGLMTRLHSIIDGKRMKRTLDMLQQERHQLFYEIEPTMVRGIVRSQKRDDIVYSCVLTEDGTYSCATPDVTKCMGLADEPCKHLLVLVIGLARAGLLDVAMADRWLLAAKTKNPRWNKTVQNYVSDSLLKYKGVQAGEIDWRPTETIPEDFYAM
jgi:uncharacterized protein YjbI with pentapeptide repeats